MPVIPNRDKDAEPDHEDLGSSEQPSNRDSKPIDEDPIPLCRLELRDLSTKGSNRFLKSIDPSTIIQNAIHTVHAILTPNAEGTPNVRSITLILQSFEGVAYTRGKDIDFEHKEIHFSTDYIASIQPELLTQEITGVLVHEMVHVWQWNGQHTCNGGLIEGVADWVRLKAGLSPPHWRKRAESCNWDSGYEVTAYFLEWLCETFGGGSVVTLNQKLREIYQEKTFWRDLFGNEDVETLWERYARHIADQKQIGTKRDGENLVTHNDEAGRSTEQEN